MVRCWNAEDQYYMIVFALQVQWTQQTRRQCNIIYSPLFRRIQVQPLHVKNKLMENQTYVYFVRPLADRKALTKGESILMDLPDPSGIVDELKVVGRSPLPPRLRSMRVDLMDAAVRRLLSAQYCL
jgi:hypothetical protein